MQEKPFDNDFKNLPKFVFKNLKIQENAVMLIKKNLSKIF